MMRFIRLLVVVLTLFAIPWYVDRVTGGFKPYKLQFDIPPQDNWISSPISDEVREILKGPFVYLGRGSQMYAFSNGDYVLKFMRFDKAYVSLWKRCLGLLSHKTKILPSTRVERSLNSCALAYREAKEETGLCAIHLVPTEEGLGEVELRLPFGHTIRLPLDRYRFVLQKRVVQMRDLFKTATLEEKKELIHKLFRLIAKRAQKGLVNRDLNIMRNFGFHKGVAFEFDCGCYSPAEGRPWQQEIDRFRAKIQRQIRDPELLVSIHDSIEEVLKSERTSPSDTSGNDS